MTFDLHIHSKYSYDSLMLPEKIIKIAKKEGLGCISITDHNSIKGSLEAKKYEDDDIKVILGEELFTDHGDLIALNIKKEIKEKNFFRAIKEIKKQGGISLLPHPHNRHSKVDAISDSVDLIEAYNSRSAPELNKKARQLADRKKKPFLCGSDAHFYRDIGNSKNRLEDNSLFLSFLENSHWTIPASQIIKSLKAKKIKILSSNLLKFLLSINFKKKIEKKEKIELSRGHKLLIEKTLHF